MIYTEKEASEKRCTPSLVLLLLEKERYEAFVLTDSITMRCIGSRCAQWRWYEIGTGYCGLAGKPAVVAEK